jgi:transposase
MIQGTLSFFEEFACMTTTLCDAMLGVNTTADTIPDDIGALKAALLAERAARREFEARASGAEAMVAHLKLLIAKMKRDRFGASSERSRKLLDQMEMQLEELETAAAEDEAAAAATQPDTTNVRPFARAKPVRAPLPAHLPRERIVVPSPTSCPCCGGKLAKLGETITETLESIPCTYKVIQTVREKFSCRACETITQPPAPFHPIARGRAGANLLAEVMLGKFCDHQPLNRQSESFAREGIDLSVSTLADWVGACTTSLTPLVTLIRSHVFAAERIHGDDIRCRCWPRRRPSRAGCGPMCAMIAHSAVRPNQPRSSSTRATAAASIPVGISPAIRGFCRRMPMLGSTISTIQGENPRRSAKRRAGRTGGANCSCSPMSQRRRWRSKRCAGSMRSSMSSATSTAYPPSGGASSGRLASRRLSAPWKPGCAPNAPGSRATTTSPAP